MTRYIVIWYNINVEKRINYLYSLWSWENKITIVHLFRGAYHDHAYCLAVVRSGLDRFRRFYRRQVEQSFLSQPGVHDLGRRSRLCNPEVGLQQEEKVARSLDNLSRLFVCNFYVKDVK